MLNAFYLDWKCQEDTQINNEKLATSHKIDAEMEMKQLLQEVTQHRCLSQQNVPVQNLQKEVEEMQEEITRLKQHSCLAPTQVQPKNPPHILL